MQGKDAQFIWYGHVAILLKTIYKFPFHPETPLLETLPKVKAGNNLNVDQLDENERTVVHILESCTPPPSKCESFGYMGMKRSQVKG